MKVNANIYSFHSASFQSPSRAPRVYLTAGGAGFITSLLCFEQRFLNGKSGSADNAEKCTYHDRQKRQGGSTRTCCTRAFEAEVDMIEDRYASQRVAKVNCRGPGNHTSYRTDQHIGKINQTTRPGEALFD